MSRRTSPAGSVALLLIAGGLLLATIDPLRDARGEAAATTALQPVNVRTIDGDTFEDLATGDRYRLENIDTPETGPRAHCAAERELGNRATRQARALMSGARRLDVRRTGRIDRYHRVIAFVLIDGRDLGELMMAQGLARPWRGRREPWCDASGNLIP